MKNRMLKISGVIMALALLAVMLVPAVPASSTVLDMTWSAQEAPGATPFNVLLPDAKSTGAWLYDVSSDGQTIFAINYDYTYTVTLYKSTNGGLTFSTAALGVNLPASLPVDIALSSDYAVDNTVMVAFNTALYRSVNGGATFDNIVNVGSLPNDGTTINAIAVGPSYDGGQAILVATDNGASRFTSNSGWQNLGFTGNVLDIAFSPDHAEDSQILAVTTSMNGGNSEFYLDTKCGENAVNVDIGRALLFSSGGQSPINRASLAFTADYNIETCNRVFVGLGVSGIGAQSTAPGSDVYRVSGVKAGSSSVTRLNMGGIGTDTNVYSLAFKGSVADGWLYAGIQNPGMGPRIWRAASVDAGTVTFIPNAKSPTGVYNTNVKCLRSATDTKIFAMVSGPGSALSISTDGGVTFNQISLINISSPANIQFVDLSIIDLNHMFLIIADGAPVTGGIYSRLFKTTDGGANWQSMLSTTQAAFVADPDDCLKAIHPSPAYSVDKNLYVTSGTYKIYKSSNEGLTFTTYSSPNSVDITAFLPIDANSYLIGAASGIYKSGSYTATAISGQTPYSFAYISDTDMFVGTTSGSVYRSTNGRASYVPVGTPASLGANVMVRTDVNYATNKVVYAASAAGIFRWTIDTSASWSTLKTGNFTSISQSSDGTLYASDITIIAAHNNSRAQIQRCLTPTFPATSWDTMIAYSATGTGTAITGLQGYVPETSIPVSGKVAVVSAGTTQIPSNMIYSLVASIGGPGIYGVKDTVVAGPVIASPAANAQVASDVTFTWSAPATAYAPLKYDFQIGNDLAFLSTVVNASSTGAGQISGTLYIPASGLLLPGHTYYCRVRVGTGSPMSSRWSETLRFTVMGPPVVITRDATNITATAATLNGSVVSLGSAGTVFSSFEYWPGTASAAAGHQTVNGNPAFISSSGDSFTCTLSGLVPSTTYSYRAIAAGHGDPVQGNVVTFSTTSSGQAITTLTYNLDKGWNTFSTPVSLNPSCNTISQVMADVDFDIIYRYDAQAQVWGIVTGDYQLAPCEAVFIHLIEPATITLQVNQNLTPPPVKLLYPGWNLVGLASLSQMPASQALASVNQVTGGLAGCAVVLSPSLSHQTGWAYTQGQTLTNQIMEPAKGYWVFMINGGTLCGFTTTPVTAQ